jgi:hypothetical protein
VPCAADASATDAMRDDEGPWEQVRRRGWNRRGTSRQDGDAAVGNANGGAEGPADGVDGDVQDAEEGPGDAAAEAAPSPTDLQRAWHDEVALVKRLRQQGLPSEHPAMRAACAARDGAERAWRDAKDPTPPAVRLARVQAKLDRAIALQAETRQTMRDCEQAHREKMRELQARLDEDASRVRTRRQQLEQVQEEVGAAGAGRANAERGEAVRQAHGALCREVAPAIASLVEQVDSSSPAWTTLNGILGTLAASSALLEKAIPPATTAQSFNIGDQGRGSQRADDDEWEGWSDGWSESHELPGHDEAGGGGGHWGRDGGDLQGSEERRPEHSHDASMGTGEWWDSSPAQWPTCVRWQACGHGKWTRGSWADEWEREAEEGGDDGGAPPRCQKAPRGRADARRWRQRNSA